jgi:long-chain acyl-CoA synthetase
VRVVGQLPITAAQKLDRVALRRAVRGEQELATG